MGVRNCTEGEVKVCLIQVCRQIEAPEGDTNRAVQLLLTPTLTSQQSVIVRRKDNKEAKVLNKNTVKH